MIKKKDRIKGLNGERIDPSLLPYTAPFTYVFSTYTYGSTKQKVKQFCAERRIRVYLYETKLWFRTEWEACLVMAAFPDEIISWPTLNKQGGTPTQK